MYGAMQRLGPVPFSEADHGFARDIQSTLGPDDIDNAWRAVGVPAQDDAALCDFVVPLGTTGEPMIGSTDVGDVSWAVPTVQARVATHAIGTPGHSWQITAQGKADAAHKGLTHAAKIMATTAKDFFADSG